MIFWWWITHFLEHRNRLLHVVHTRDEGAGDGTLVVGRALLDELLHANQCWHDAGQLFLFDFISRIFYTTFSLFSQHFQLQIAPPSRTWLAVYRYIYLLISLSNRDSSHFTLFFHTQQRFRFSLWFSQISTHDAHFGRLEDATRDFSHFSHRASLSLWTLAIFSRWEIFPPLSLSSALGLFAQDFWLNFFFLSSLFSLHAAKLLRFGRI